MSIEGVARFLIAAGAGLLFLGGLMFLAARLGIDRLPGDFVWRGERVTVYIPIGLSILASIVLTIVLNIILRR